MSSAEALLNLLAKRCPTTADGHQPCWHACHAKLAEIEKSQEARSLRSFVQSVFQTQISDELELVTLSELLNSTSPGLCYGIMVLLALRASYTQFILERSPERLLPAYGMAKTFCVSFQPCSCGEDRLPSALREPYEVIPILYACLENDTVCKQREVIDTLKRFGSVVHLQADCPQLGELVEKLLKIGSPEALWARFNLAFKSPAALLVPVAELQQFVSGDPTVLPSIITLGHQTAEAFQPTSTAGVLTPVDQNLSLPASVHNWTALHVQQWLFEGGFGQFTTGFADIDGERLLQLDRADLVLLAQPHANTKRFVLLQLDVDRLKREQATRDRTVVVVQPFKFTINKPRGLVQGQATLRATARSTIKVTLEVPLNKPDCFHVVADLSGSFELQGNESGLSRRWIMGGVDINDPQAILAAKSVACHLQPSISDGLGGPEPFAWRKTATENSVLWKTNNFCPSHSFSRAGSISTLTLNCLYTLPKVANPEARVVNLRIMFIQLLHDDDGHRYPVSAVEQAHHDGFALAIKLSELGHRDLRTSRVVSVQA